MPEAPSTDNFTLGKGVLYLNKKDQQSGLYLGERDLGNAPEFSYNVNLEKLPHYTSRGGISSKDLEIVSQLTPGISFTLDELNADNISLLNMATTVTVTQNAGVVTAEAVTAKLGLRQELANREIGLTTLPHGTVTGGPFVVGETVTGGTSSATGIVAMVSGAYVQVATDGTFVDGETITGDTSLATADLAGSPVWVAGVLLIQDEADAVTYVAGVDYAVDTTLKDDIIGRVKFLDDGSITNDEVVHITYGYRAATWTKIKCFTETVVEGFVRFVSDNPQGNQQEIQIWRVSLSASGDTAMIGDDWSTMGFIGEVLKDTENHPDSPYMDILM